MSNRWPVLFVLALGACGEASEPGLVARVGGWTLTETELAELLVLAQPFPLDLIAVEDLARHWIGAAALAQRAARGDDLTSDAAVTASSWLERREALLAADREDRLGSTAVPEPEAAYRAGGLRLLAHVLRRVGPETSTAEVDLQRRTAQRVLAALVAGGSCVEAGRPAPRIISFCSGNLLNTPEEVLEEARLTCPDREVTFYVADSFWTPCGLLQPVRASFLCTPRPKAE